MYPFRDMKAIFLGLLVVLMASQAGAQTAQDKAYVETRQGLVADLEAKRKSLPEPVDDRVWGREEARAHETLEGAAAGSTGFAAAPQGLRDLALQSRPGVLRQGRRIRSMRWSSPRTSCGR